MKIYIHIIVSTIIASLIVACGGESTQPKTKTKTGVVVGSIIGAAIGLMAGNKNKGKSALIGAAIGAAAGGAIGYNIKNQAKEVAETLDTEVNNNPNAEKDINQDLIVSNTDSYVKIMIRDKMMFKVNDAVPTPSAYRKVEKIAAILEKYPTTIVQSVGHTDNTGSYNYNLRLSEDRAISVKNIIYNKSNVPNRIIYKGCSFSKPIANNTSRINRDLNRRVEIYLYPDERYIIQSCR